MRLEIQSDSTPRSTGFPAVPKSVRVSPGDVISGRILNIDPDGKTLLQLGASRVLSAHSFGGKVGEELLFEVLSPHAQGEYGRPTKTGLSVRLARDSTDTSRLSQGPKSGKTTPVHVHSGAKTVSTAPQRSLMSAAPAGSTGADSLEGLVARVWGAFAAAGNRWGREIRRRLSGRAIRPTSCASESTAPTSIRQPANRTASGVKPTPDYDHRETASFLDDSSSFLIGAAGDTPRFVRISLGNPADQPSSDENDSILTASLMMDLENTGAIEIDLKMEGDQIGVNFKVGNESICKEFENGMGGLYTGLKALVRKVYCLVRVDHRLAGYEADIESDTKWKEIDFKV